MENDILDELNTKIRHVFDTNEDMKQALKHGYWSTKQNFSVTLSNSFTFLFTIQLDQLSSFPWDESDGHGKVVHKKPGETAETNEWSLGKNTGFFYNFEESIKIALRDNWDAPPYGKGTDRQRAMRAMKADYDYLNDFMLGKWNYLDIKAECAHTKSPGIILSKSLIGGVESNLDSIVDAAVDMAVTAHADARRELLKLQEISYQSTSFRP